MTDVSSPQLAEGWSKILLAENIPSEFGTEKLRLDRIEEEASYPELSKELKANPFLCLKILSAANEAQKDPDAKSKTLEHAMSMLGILQTQRILKSYPSGRKSKKHKLFYQQVSDSVSCAQLATNLAKAGHAHANVVQDAFWGTLLSFAPLWHMQRAAPEKMKAYRALVNPNDIAAQENDFWRLAKQDLSHLPQEY